MQQELQRYDSFDLRRVASLNMHMIFFRFLMMTRFTVLQAIEDHPRNDDHEKNRHDTKDQLPALHLGRTTLFRMVSRVCLPIEVHSYSLIEFE
jgi:hypothetical protein